ncbi:hypothetical protein KY360_05450 [Candidatus Woesearchaeota archaeon]|nr:hypothetical protein [Candidatus Woesearchaeota archaeon]
MTMLCNIEVYPTVEGLARAGYEMPKPVSVPLVGVYQGSFRIADGKSVSVLSSPLQRHNQEQRIDLDRYNALFADRTVMIERSLEGWLEGSHAIETDNRMPFIGAVQTMHQRLAVAYLNKYVHDELMLVPLKDVGKAVSMLETVRQKIKNYMATEEYKALSKGKELNIEQIAINIIAGEVMPGQDIAAITTDGKTLAVNKDYTAMIKALADYYDMDPETLDMYFIMAHEMAAHGALKIHSESELEAHIHEFFKKLAEKEPRGHALTVPRTESSKRQLYLDLARIAETRLGEVRENYGFIKSLGARLEAYIRQAIEEEGLDYEDAVDYAKAMVEEELKEESEKEADYAKTNETDDGEPDADEADAEGEPNSEEEPDADDESAEPDAGSEEADGEQ